MTDGPSVEQIVSGLQRRYRDLRDDAAMTDATRKVGDLSTTISGLPSEIDQLRERGYAFAGYLGARAEALQAQWSEANSRISIAIQGEASRLTQQVSGIDPLMTKLGMAGGKETAVKMLARQIEASMDTLEDDVESAGKRVEGLFGNIGKDTGEIEKKVRKFNWYMDQVDEAEFDFNATESVYIVVKGEWVKTGKGKQDPDGIFYLTDQRLIFERKEKEGGFLGFGAKKVQGIEWDIALSAIEKVESEKRGMFGGKDIVHINASGAPANPVTIEVKGDANANWYAQQLERAKKGDISQERAIEIAPEIVEMVRNAPTACGNCGAPFTTPITQGMVDLACEYCGTIVRL